MKLHRDLGITQKSVLNLLHKLRKSWENEGIQFEGPIEFDEDLRMNLSLASDLLQRTESLERSKDCRNNSAEHTIGQAGYSVPSISGHSSMSTLDVDVFICACSVRPFEVICGISSTRLATSSFSA